MNRRDLLGLIGGATALSPHFALAQQKPMPVIGYFHLGSPGPFAPFTAAFLQGLSEAGYVEGRNVAIEYRFAEGHEDRQPALAAELVARKVDLIVTVGAPTTRIAEVAATSIPIVFFTGDDPVADGLVASLARPGGNATGITLFGDELNPKRLELLSELVPQARTVAVLVNRSNRAALPGLPEAARAKAIRIEEVPAGSAGEIDGAFAALAGRKTDALAMALIVTSNVLFFSRREQIVAAAARIAIPAIYYRREFVTAGGLIAYGPSYAAGYRQLGTLTAKVLGGAKPADLPVQQPTKFELAINLKIAKTLGLTVPPVLLAQADEVIE
ncbi:MAG TPA: ABC transporter substrate-binding protein [Stellaceae bacterium]|jgi:putative ABC transport system substrate-binding protein|nr:ABC transporter substrate-binding protein [Stellaceae bacterium]